MEHEETGCQPPPEGPILCVNNCGFFGSPANMNMCSKCYKDTVLKQQQVEAAASSIEDIVNGSSSSIVRNEQVVIRAMAIESQPSKSGEIVEPESREGRTINRCNTCKKRVGITAFKCRCGDIFCGAHRYSDKHGCLFDYRMAGRDEIAKANPVVKGEKLDKI